MTTTLSSAATGTLPLDVARSALAALWHDAGLPPDALQRVHLHGEARGFESRFAVGAATQASVAATGLAASEIAQWRAPQPQAQQVSVDAQHAAFESTSYFTLDGVQLPNWAPQSGVYRCGQALPGAADQSAQWVRVHANFAHHRDGVLRLLGLPEDEATPRQAVADALAHWTALDFEAAAAKAGLVVAAGRTAEEWRAHTQSAAVAAHALLSIERVDEEGAESAAPLAWPAVGTGDRPLSGLRVLDLTRILAGPVAGRTLAAHGADVMLINSPNLPNIDAIADTSRGKRSALVDLQDAAGQATLRELLASSHVFLQGYRPGSLEALGWGVDDVVRLRPGIVYASLSAYGRTGPWADRRGFDSLVQMVSGLNADEASAFGAKAPQALPMQVLDYCAGFLLAYGIEVALLRQATQGGSWHVELSLAGVAQWLRSLGEADAAAAGALVQQPKPDIAAYMEATPSGFGLLNAVRHSGQLSASSTSWSRPSMPPGSDAPSW